MTDKIEAQTKALAEQLKKLNDAKTDEEYLKELEKYGKMVEGADFSIESQAASKKKKLTLTDKVIAPVNNSLAKQINKVNKKLINHNKNGEKT